MAVYIGLFPANHNYKLWTNKHIYVYFYVSSYQLRAGRNWSWYYTFQIGNTLGEIHIQLAFPMIALSSLPCAQEIEFKQKTEVWGQSLGLLEIDEDR